MKVLLKLQENLKELEMTDKQNINEIADILGDQIARGETLQAEIHKLMSQRIGEGMLPVIALGTLMAQVQHVVSVMVTLRAVEQERAPTEQEGRDLFKIVADKLLEQLGDNIRSVYSQVTASEAINAAIEKSKAA